VGYPPRHVLSASLAGLSLLGYRTIFPNSNYGNSVKDGPQILLLPFSVNLIQDGTPTCYLPHATCYLPHATCILLPASTM
jgi:hypothetical protein